MVTLKCCIAGVGRMGQRHLQVAKSLGFEICGLYDPSDEAIGKTLAAYNLPRTIAFSSAGEMLEKTRPQAFVVSSTAPSHCDLVCRAVDEGVRYLLCEKPMAISLRECDRMIATCLKANSVLGINHQMRYMAQYAIVKELAGSPELGGLRSVTVVASNLGLSMNGSHYFEAFRFLTDEEIVSVSAWLDPDTVANPRGPQYEDRSGQLRAVSHSGKRLSLEFGVDQGHGIHVVYGCRFGHIYSDQLSGFLRIVYREARYRELPTTQYAMPSIEEVRQIPAADVIAPTQALWRSMLAGESYPDGKCGRHALAGIVAANISGEQGGTPIRLAEVPTARQFAWA